MSAPSSATRLEHANLIVRDVDAVVRFLTTALPDFAIRGEGLTSGGDRWVHVGNEGAYVALTQASRDPGHVFENYGGAPGTNHLGFVVPDAAAVRARMAAAGYVDSTPPNDHPHRRRVYFLDDEGRDWEFVEYLSDEPGERNDYALPDPARPANPLS